MSVEDFIKIGKHVTDFSILNWFYSIYHSECTLISVARNGSCIFINLAIEITKMMQL